MLGHDDPTMIRMLEDMTGVDAQKIPLDDPDTMSIFTSSKVLGYGRRPHSRAGPAPSPSRSSAPASRAECCRRRSRRDLTSLIRLSGFSHGTDVWLGNARDLILSKTATVNDARSAAATISCCTSSNAGCPPSDRSRSWRAVRKGQGQRGGFQDGWVETMQAHGVPEWYITALSKIAYLFPKAPRWPTS